MLDEASHETFICVYKEQSGYSIVGFVKRAILYFGYIPQIIQTDNGTEFYYSKNMKRIHIFYAFCAENHIIHKQIRPKTPWHNDKVEHSHRSDKERLYKYLDLQLQMENYLRRSNCISMPVLGWKNTHITQKTTAAGTSGNVVLVKVRGYLLTFTKMQPLSFFSPTSPS